jgi:hypothetical protein
MDPDGRADVFTVWIPKFDPGLPTGIAHVSSPHSAARPGVPHVKDVLQAKLSWQRTGKYLDMNAKQEIGSDAEMVTFEMPLP